MKSIMNDVNSSIQQICGLVASKKQSSHTVYFYQSLIFAIFINCALVHGQNRRQEIYYYDMCFAQEHKKRGS